MPVPDIQHNIRYTFKEHRLLERALTHKSYANEHRAPEHNERMEFLGDAVLNLLVSELLMNSCPDSSEGDLSRLRAAVVSETALAKVARTIDLGTYLLLGRGEEQSGGREKESLLANTLEALIAAVYLDGGKEESEAFIKRFFDDIIRKTCSGRATPDYKTRLQELCQDQIKQLPAYRLAAETGPDHLKQFEVEVWIKGELSGRGTGKTKKEAEQRAAKAALERLAAV